jgi:hypothetical protein
MKYKKAKKLDLYGRSVPDYYRALADSLPMALENREALKKSYYAYAKKIEKEEKRYGGDY